MRRHVGQNHQNDPLIPSPSRVSPRAERGRARTLVRADSGRGEGVVSMVLQCGLVGATGSVGRELLIVPDQRVFPAGEVVRIASRRSQGTEVSYGDRVLTVQALENFDFSGTDIALMSAGGSVSKEWSPRI